MNLPIVCGLATLVSALSLAQSADKLVFDVAAIKPSDPANQRSEYFATPGGGFSGRNLTLKVLIERAYDLQDFQVSGGGGWINSERYDIRAKALRNAQDESLPDDLTKMTPEQGKRFQDQFSARVRALLADRFGLKFRVETKDGPIYALVVAKRGAKIHEAQGVGRNLRLGKSELDAKSMPIAALARILSQRLGRPVLDETGLKREYDFTLQWTPDPSPDPLGNAGAPAGPSLFTAVEEQLGLKLESRRGPLDTFVIEHAERPSEN
jgi:uncharacterized protein (TIGR03435 family)